MKKCGIGEGLGFRHQTNLSSNPDWAPPQQCNLDKLFNSSELLFSLNLKGKLTLHLLCRG